MDTIASFEVNHTRLVPGMYVSRVDGDIVTYDLRLCRPNRETLPIAAMHTLEHLFAVLVRNGSFGKYIIYFGPMGCRTGFYLLVRDLSPAECIGLVRKTFCRIAAWEGVVPGCSEKECGNWKEHNLADAVRAAKQYCSVLEHVSENTLKY